ncbi:MAG: glycosyltransferase, partial [Candidatus Methanomethylophilaceae archaeon]|nr:glycosyltransferase [Candidatus Methanomethylophilaceae archaeon]
DTLRKQAFSGRNPGISVVVPVFNVQNYIGTCLESIRSQSFTDYEVICVDDGSSDRSADICSEYAGRDQRFRLIRKSNGGLSSSRNRGAETASGEYLYFLDSDDSITPDALKELYDLMRREKLDIVCFDAETVFESRKIAEAFPWYEDYYRNRNVRSEPMSGPELLRCFTESGDDVYRTAVQLCMFSRDFYVRSGLSNYDGILHEDNLLTFQALMAAERAMYVPRAYYRRLIRGNSIMTKKGSFKNLYGYAICAYEIMSRFGDTGPGKRETERICGVFRSIISDRRFPAAEKERINTMSVTDKIKFAAVPVISGDEYFLISGKPIVTVIVEASGSNAEDTLKTVLNQTLRDTECFAVVRPGVSVSVPGVSTFLSLRDAEAGSSSRYIIETDSSCRMEPFFAARAVDRIRSMCLPSCRFVSEDGKTSALIYVKGFGKDPADTVASDWIRFNEGDPVELRKKAGAPENRNGDDRLKDRIRGYRDSFMTFAGIVYNRMRRRSGFQYLSDFLREV